MKLYLHIGTEKTGTTTIQKVLYKNKTVLQQNGFHFLQCAGAENNRALPAYCMEDERYDDFFKKNKINTLSEKADFKNEFKSRLDYELNNLPSNIHSVIISSEHFHSRVNSKKEVENAFKLFSEYFSEVDVVCYLREQASTCSALYSTAIKTGLSISLNEMVANCVPSNNYYNYYKMLSNWRSVFFESTFKIRVFDKALFLNSDLISDFFNQIDSDIISNLSKDVDYENESLTEFGQFFGRAINKAYPKFTEHGDINMVRERAIKTLSVNFRGKGADILKSDRERIYHDFNESNRLLNKEYFGCDKNLFSGSNIASNESFELSDENFYKIVNVLSELSDKNTRLPPSYADIFRDVAIHIEKEKPYEAYKLMELASVIRPNGGVIRKKIKEYLKILK